MKRPNGHNNRMGKYAFGCAFLFPHYMEHGGTILKIWAIKTNWATNDETGSDVTLYATEVLARTAFEKAVKDEIEYYGIDFNDQGCGYTIEKTDDFFDVFKNEEYLLNHSTISLEELLIVEK